MRRVIRAIVQQASISVLVNLSLFKFWMWKIVQASMETLWAELTVRRQSAWQSSGLQKTGVE